MVAAPRVRVRDGRTVRRLAAAALTGLLAVGLVACGGTGGGPSAAGAGTWSTAVHPEPKGLLPGYSSIYGVSCPTASFCAAVDESGDATFWDGARWSVPAPASPDGTLNSVSCPTATFCVAVSGQLAVTWNGRAWSAPVAVGPAPSGPTGGQYRVSCVSPAFCASVNTAGVVRLFDGSSWGHDAVVEVGTATRPVQSVSCASPTFCVVVSATGDIATFTGSSWSTRPSPGRSLLHAVSCPRPSFCMATDLTGHALVFDGSSWRPAAPVPGPGALTYAVSCPTSTSCSVARSDGSVATWTSGSWGQPRSVVHDGTLSAADISCASTSFCALVDSAGSVATYRG